MYKVKAAEAGPARVKTPFDRRKPSMRSSFWAAIVGFGCIAVAGCTTQTAAPLTADEAMVLLRSGRPVLTCRDACLASWRESQPQAQRLAEVGNWRDLAILVERVGYQDDLSLYYLGRAAEGLGYDPAAASFYRQSMQISGTSLSCLNLSKQCGGAFLPRDASLRLAAIDNALKRPSVRRPAHPSTAPPATPAAPEATPTSAETEAPTALAPAALAPAAPVPGAAPQNPPSDTTEFIEPPPAPAPR
jgi:hypothetical protein